MTRYYRPLVQTDPARPGAAQTLAGGWAWFTHLEVLTRSAPARIIAADAAPSDVLARLTASRAPIAGLAMTRPQIMGILNLTPDSFSDGGTFNAPDAALARGHAMVQTGSDILDFGGESTRPGATEVAIADEIARTAPVIAALRAAGLSAPISIDTRKSAVAAAALDAGANLINDVSGLDFDPMMAALAANRHVPICLMHAQGPPETMQHDPQYGDVVLDVYDALAERIARAEAAGIARAQIIVDPGIGFGKTQIHNLALLARISVFHGLGCPILLGASRKRFVGTIGNAPEAVDRGPGSAAIGLHALAQGVQVLRVHDIELHKQAIALWQAATGKA
jgi:dihydropteroate synthase